MPNEFYTKHGSLLLVALTLLLVLFVPTMVVVGQNKNSPKKKYAGSAVKLENLLKVLQGKQFKSNEIIEIVEVEGVDFQLSAATKEQLTSTGASPALIKSIRENYRTKNDPIISRGVLNHLAISLPIPLYPSAAKAVNASGVVTVQVTIAKNGRVFSAEAVSGHQLLRAAAEQAARQAEFKPTVFYDRAVRVSGVIVYHLAPK